MKTLMVVLGMLLSCNTMAASVETAFPCPEPYLEGIQQFKDGQLQAASESFSEAIGLADSPDVEYLPYLYLAVVQFEMGHTREARDALIRSQMYGVAPQSETGKLLLEHYATDIMKAPLDDSEFVSLPQSSPVETQSTWLTDNEVDLIRAQVLKRCALSSKLAENKLPWYFHYEFGVNLMQAGDAKRAVDALLVGANIREDPKRSKRMYGMWYIDYLPYYQIALAHSKLGNWESALGAIQTSENFGEFKPGDPGFESFAALNELINSNL
jgi:hypothetical protein